MLNDKLFLRIAANSALGLILIFIWSRFVDLPSLLQHMRNLDTGVMVFFFLAFIFSGLMRGLRLKLLLSKQGRPASPDERASRGGLSLKEGAMLTFLGQFLSFLIPVRAGEITKSVYLTSRLDVSLAKSVVWVFIDRFLDFLGILMIIVLFLSLIPTNLPEQFLLITAAILLGFVLFFVLAVVSEDFLKKLLVFLSNFILIKTIAKRFVSFTYSIVEGFEVLRQRPLNLASILFITFIALVSDGFIWLTVFKSLGTDLNIYLAILGNALAALTFLIPSAPGYVGSAEAATLAVYSGALGMDANLVSAAAVVFHLLTILALLFFGVTSLYFLKFNLSGVWKRIRGE